MLIAGLSILGGAFLLRSVSERSIANNYFLSTQAFWLAEAGIQRSFWELNHNGCGGCPDPTCDACTISGTSSLGSGNYSAYITSGYSGGTITSTGTFSDPNTNSAQRTIQATISTESVWRYGIFCQGNIRFQNSASTDSYDSDKGDYNALLAGGTYNIGTNGDVGTNSTAQPAITLENSSQINGDAGVGSTDWTAGIALNGSGGVAGQKTGGVDILMPSVPVPDTPTGGWWTFALPEGTTSLPSGSYTAASVTLDNKHDLSITGDVTLYVTGNIDLGNDAKLDIATGGKLTLYINGTFTVAQTASVNNLSKIPSDFRLYSRYSGSDSGVTFNNNTALYGAIYAPDSGVTLEQSFDLYGSVVSGSASLFNSTQVHYDEALGRDETPFTTPIYVSDNWHESPAPF